MNERIIELIDIAPKEFWGTQDAHLEAIKKYYPKLKIVARGTILKAYGEDEVLNEFESREYGFVNKRLPVIKLAYDTPEKTTYFIETSTSRLAAVIENSDKIEGYSFAIFHKFLFMDWAGKNVRDLTMVLAALVVLIVSVLGLILFIKKN